MIKNTAGQKWVVVAIDLLERIPMLGDAANLSATISKDGGNYTAIANPTFTELGEGRYVFTLSQAETNCDRFHILPQSATAAVVVANEETNFTTEVRAPLATAVASQVRTELTTELARIDVATSTRLASASYTAPDNAGIAAANVHLVAIKGDGWTSGDTLRNINSGLGPAVGPGSILKTLTITDGVAALDGVEVWVSTDLGGGNVIAGTLHTDGNGEVSFTLDPGTYYAWCQRSGTNFTNPTQFTVT